MIMENVQERILPYQNLLRFGYWTPLTSTPMRVFYIMTENELDGALLMDGMNTPETTLAAWNMEEPK